MYLKTDDDNLKSLHPDEIEPEAVEFSDNNLAQCSQDVGEQLLQMERYDGLIWEHEP